jgi:cytidine deaminase
MHTNIPTQPPDTIFLVEVSTLPLGEMLVSSFGPESLLVPDEEHLFCEQPSHTTLLLPAAAASMLSAALQPTTVRLSPARLDQLLAAGLHAVRRSYAPHSHSPSGVVALYECATSGGDSVRGGEEWALATGSYMENAAYNPSLPPLQCALIPMMLEAGQSAGALRLVVLFERADARILQAEQTSAFVRQIAPHCACVTVHL